MKNERNPGDYEIGYGKPPGSTRFRKGQSGNPSGRSRGRRNELPYEAVLGQMVTIREDGVGRQVTAAEAFILQMTKQGLEGNSNAARKMMDAIKEARAARLKRGYDSQVQITYVIVTPGSVNRALEPLRMAKKLDRYRETARMALEPWIVEAALARLGDCRLTVEEQRSVYKATRTPWKVQWPEWWGIGDKDLSTRNTLRQSARARPKGAKRSSGS